MCAPLTMFRISFISEHVQFTIAISDMLVFPQSWQTLCVHAVVVATVLHVDDCDDNDDRDGHDIVLR